MNTDKLELVPTKDVSATALKFERGFGSDQENRYFTRIAFSPDSSKFVMTWSSRAATQSKSVVCNTSTTGADCKVKKIGKSDNYLYIGQRRRNWRCFWKV